MDQRIWDNITADYDRGVEDNPNPIITRYLEREMEILASLCKSVCKSNDECSVIDMGAGTGRAIFALDKELRRYSVYFYGVEGLEPMLKRVNQKRS